MDERGDNQYLLNAHYMPRDGLGVLSSQLSIESSKHTCRVNLINPIESKEMGSENEVIGPRLLNIRCQI